MFPVIGLQLLIRGDGVNTVLTLSVSQMAKLGVWKLFGVVMEVPITLQSFPNGTASGPANINYTTSIDATGTLVTFTFASAPAAGQDYSISANVG